jgi:hypothetical protein
VETSSPETVKAEFDRIDGLVAKEFQPRQLVRGGPGSHEALVAFAGTKIELSGEVAADRRKSFDPAVQQKRQVLELEKHGIEGSSHPADEPPRVDQTRWLATRLAIIKPRVSTRMWRLRPFTRLCPSKPRVPPRSVVLTD